MKMTNFKSAALVLRPQSNLLMAYKTLQSILKKYDINLYVEKQSAKLLHVKGYSFEKLIQKCDFFISLGGDGTILFTCRSIYPHKTPIIGINAGNLGFLTLVKQDEMQWFFKQLLSGKCEIESRVMFEVDFIKDKKVLKKDIAFNDVVFSRNSLVSMVKINAFANKKLFNSYYGDGVIASTPTGSTAYNLSAGGAIIHPLAKAFILTSICPHSLTQRPLVLPMEFILEFKSNDDVIVSIDGQNHYKMKNFDTIKVSIAKENINLIYHEKRDYFNTLREKLNWGNR